MELHNQANIKEQPEIEGNQEKLAQTQWRRREKKKDENGTNQRRGTTVDVFQCTAELGGRRRRLWWWRVADVLSVVENESESERRRF